MRRDGDHPEFPQMLSALDAAGAGGNPPLRKRIQILSPPKAEVKPAKVPVLVMHFMRVPQPDGSILMKPMKPVEEAEEIGTMEASTILGLSQRRVNEMCDEGIFVEGVDWWRPRGKRRAGQYHIKRSAVLREKYGPEWENKQQPTPVNGMNKNKA